MKTQTQKLGEYVVQVATTAAQLYIDQQGADVDGQALTGCLQNRTREALPKAMAEYKDAIEAHMDDIAQRTFQASICLAGIAAAKDAILASTKDAVPA